jgi:hypothetical protein
MQMKISAFAIIFVACVFLAQPVPGHAQTNKTTTPPKAALAEINSYTTEIDRFIKRNPKARIFGDVSPASPNRTSRWREFKSEAARKKAETGENLNQNAFVWSREGKLVGANFTFTSPSGDWAHIIMYYFREDGSLAKIQAQLNTFNGEISVVRDRYYDPGGRLLKTTRKFLDLQTQKPKKPGEFMDKPIPVYHKVAELPFHNLL